MGPILASLPFGDVVVWDNSKRTLDLLVFGRYAGIEEAEHEVVYVQDDDCVLLPGSFGALLGAYEDGALVCNMPGRFRPHYPDSALVGFGAVFRRDLPESAFTRWAAAGYEMDTEAFARCCDVVFTTLTDRVLVDVGYSDLPYASAPDRMWKQPSHYGERMQVLEAARAVREDG